MIITAEVGLKFFNFLSMISRVFCLKKVRDELCFLVIDICYVKGVGFYGDRWFGYNYRACKLTGAVKCRESYLVCFHFMTIYLLKLFWYTRSY
jgi:hypothetical protein